MEHNAGNVKAELCAIFPQHSAQTIRVVYENIIQLNEDTPALVLPSCINALLELPPDVLTEEQQQPRLNTMKDRRKVPVPGLASSDSDTSSSNSDYETFHNDFEGYRNRKRNIYREPNRFSSSSESEKYFSDEDSLIFHSENIKNIEETYTKKEVVVIRDSPLQNRKRKLSSNGIYEHHKIGKKKEKEDLQFLLNENKSENSVSTNTAINNINDYMYIVNKRSSDVSSDGVSIVPSAVSLNAVSNNTSASLSGTLNGPSHGSNNDSTYINHAATAVQPDISSIRKGMQGYLGKAKELIKGIIVDVEENFLETIINQQEGDISVPEVVNRVVEYLLDGKNYPKVNKNGPEDSRLSSICSSTVTSDPFLYNKHSIFLLQNAFPKISTKVIRFEFHQHERKYAATFSALESALEDIISGKKRVEETIIKSFLRGRRNKMHITSLDAALESEVKELEEKKKGDLEKGDFLIASAINEEQYEEDGQAIECGCCYCEVPFDEMVQCLEGHLFCSSCLCGYSKEAIYGSGKIQLYCMTSECDSLFPLSQLKKALVDNMFDKYLERVQEEDIKLANIDNLVKCPFCDFAAEMDDGDKVFRCQNPSCMKESCRHCQEEWKDHFGVPCSEIEKKGATNLRITYEEKMTEAKVRKCWQCQMIFLKSDGCNKMTCRCGAKMCYICRQPKIGYEHFCSHPRNPGEGCTSCKKCSLWTDPSEDDDRAVAEIKKQAEEERLKLAGDDAPVAVISVGPKIDPRSKIQTNRNQNHRIPHRGRGHNR